MVALREPPFSVLDVVEPVHGAALPKRVLQHLRRGNALFDAGAYEQALREYDAAVKARPNLAEALNNRGTAKLVQGNHQSAIADFDAALRSRSNFVEALNNRGWARFALGDVQGAIDDYDTALGLRPDHREALNKRGMARFAQGDLLGAIDDYQRAIDNYPDVIGNDNGTHRLLLAALRNLTLALRVANRVNDALASINRYLALRPDDAKAKALHGELLAARLRELEEEGFFLAWSGGKPKGSDPGIPITPGPPISDYIAEDRG